MSFVDDPNCPKELIAWSRVRHVNPIDFDSGGNYAEFVGWIDGGTMNN